VRKWRRGLPGGGGFLAALEAALGGPETGATGAVGAVALAGVDLAGGETVVEGVVAFSVGILGEEEV